MATTAENQAKELINQLNTMKIPPHSVEAEQSVLGGLLLNNQAFERVTEHIQPHDFYRPEHFTIYQAMATLFQQDKPVDLLTLAEQLRTTNQLETVGGEIYLYELVQNTATAANIISYAQIIRERSVLRQMIAIANDMAQKAFDPQGRTTQELLDETEQQVFKIADQTSRKNSGPIRIRDLLNQAVERIDTLFHSDGNITGLSSGYQDFDELTSGLHPADLIVVAGRPSMGKTAFAMNIAEHTAIKDKKPVLVFSMEMPGEALAMRLISSLGRINQHHIRTGRLTDEDWPRISSAVGMLSESLLFVDDTPALSPVELRARARRLAREHGGELGLIIVDYLQLMHLPGYRENRTGEISEISRSLKAVAKELKVPLIALSQLNRSLEQRMDKRPVMSDLRESGAIEQDADLIVFIYRDEVYHEDSPDKGIAEIIIGKQRNGPIGKIRLTFRGQYTRFENFASENYTARINP